MRTLKIIITAIITICFTSCFEIIEDVKLNSDGSGTFKLILNASQSASQITKVLAQDSINGIAIPQKSTIENKANKLIEQLKEQEGISNLSYTLDLKGYIFKLNFDFANINELNTAVSKIAKKESGSNQEIILPLVYSLKDNKFSKTYDSNLLLKASKKKKEAEAFLTNIEKATITSIFRFDQEIQHNSHENSKITANKKTCFEKNQIIEILDNTTLHSHNIQLK